jgi:hypothetical protein
VLAGLLIALTLGVGGSVPIALTGHAPAEAVAAGCHHQHAHHYSEAMLGAGSGRPRVMEGPMEKLGFLLQPMGGCTDFG